jgi:hypothetical protein
MDAYDLSVRYPKARGNTVLNVALTLCFGGLFLLIVAVVSVTAVVLAGDRILVSNFTYLFAVLAYLGLIVAGLVASGLNLTLPRWTSPWPVALPQDAEPVGRLLSTASAQSTRAFVARSTNSAWLRLD